MTDNWQRHASCRGVDPALFYPEVGENTHEARAVCAVCPVAKRCLQVAVDGHEPGVWGGTTERERMTLRAGRPNRPLPINHGTPGGYDTHRRRGEDACEACSQANSRAKADRKKRRTRSDAA